MARARVLLPFAAVAALAITGPLDAQPRPGGPRLLEPDRPAMRPGWPVQPRPGEEELEDVRPWLAGLLGKQPNQDPDPKALKDLLDKLNKLPKGEQPDKDQIEKILKDNPAFKNPEFLKQLEKLLQDPNFPKNLEGKLPKDVPVPDKGDGPALAEKLKDVIDGGKQGGQPDNQGAEGGKGGGGLEGEGKVPDAPAKNPYADNEWVQWLEKNFGNSPAAKEAVKDLMDSLGKGDLKGMFDEIPEFKNGGWKDLDNFGGPGGNDWKFKPPDWHFGDKGGSSWGGGGGGSSSSWGGGGAGSAGAGGMSVGLGGGGTALMVIAGIAAAIFIALMLFRRWKAEQERRAAEAALLPPGIDLDAVRTREELVKAFDHVSLEQIGEEARSWNHRVIADEFVETRPTQAAPATELAGLYERARYAPLDEDLTAGEFADARRDLRVISGGPA